MDKRTLRRLRDAALTAVILSAALGIGVLLQNILDISEHITTLFVFAVFLISLVTDGFLFGVLSTVASVILINYVFTFPYFAMDFSVPESLISAAVMLVISLLTSTLTTRLKRWQLLRAETERESMRANLLRAISHDLRTPLTTIYGASSSILENYERLSDGRKQELTRSIREDAEWLIRMVENLLSVTRIDGGRLKLIKTPTVLEELIDAVLLKFKKRYPAVNVALSLPEELVLVPMDAILVEQVIINILENAVHHAKGMTRLSLAVTLADGFAIFRIADNGCGIAADRLDRLFSGTLGTEEGADAHRRGAGIGLSLCAGIVKAHGGGIAAENTAEGGAAFTFTLPAEEENPNEQ